MKVKLGCMLRVYPETALERACEGIAKAGFRYTSYLGKGYQYEPTAPYEELLAMKATVESFGLTSVSSWAGDPCQYGLDGLLAHIERARILELEHLIVSSPLPRAHGKGEDPEAPAEDFCAVIRGAIPELEKSGVRIDVKPHGGPYGAGPRLAMLASRIDHRCFGIAYDPGNIGHFERTAPEEDITSCVSWIRSVCIKDYPRSNQPGPRRFPVPGKGKTDWKMIFRRLAEAGWSGYALVEMAGEEEPQALDELLTGLRWEIESWVEAAGGQVDQPA